MTDPVHVASPLEALIRSVTDRAGAGADDSDVRASTFARGLALGALVGAAIAGSTIWQRRHARGLSAVAIDGGDETRPRAVTPGDLPPG